MKVNTEVPILFQKLKTFEADAVDTRFIKTKIWLMHTGENLNGSFFSKESVEEALPTLANTPILAYIELNSENEKDFSDHRQVLVKEDGQFKIKYIGQCIGVIPESNNAQFEMRLCDDGVEREFLTVDGLVWEKWDDPVDIFNRDLIKAQSMELHSDYEGEWKDDKLFHFSKFSFFGACALGKEVLPAMRNATIEAQFNYDSMFSEIQGKLEQFKDFSNQVKVKVENNPIEKWECPHCLTNIREKELYFDGANWFHRPCIDSGHIVLPNEKYNQQGGIQLDITEILAKYSLSIAQLLDKGINHEEFTSIEELEEKIQEAFEIEKPDEEKTDFALTYGQLRDEIRAELYKEKQVDPWGYEYTKYWYVDFDDQKVIAEDGEDNYRLVSFDYSLNGDKVEIKFDSKNRVKIVYSPLEGESEVSFEISSKDRVDYGKKVTEKETESKFSDTQKELDDTKAKFEALENEVSELKQFKQEKLESERDEQLEALYELFSSKLDETEISSVKELAADMSVEDVETKLYVLVGKKEAKFSTKSRQRETVKVTFSVPDQSMKPSSGKPYAHLVEKHINK